MNYGISQRAVENLERGVTFNRAVRKLAAIRGDYGKGGGWICNRHGKLICQGWETYGRRFISPGLLCQDEEHNGGNGKWYVWVIGLSSDELRRADMLFGRPASTQEEN